MIPAFNQAWPALPTLIDSSMDGSDEMAQLLPRDDRSEAILLKETMAECEF